MRLQRGSFFINRATNRLGKGANVYLASAELSAITAIEGRIPDLKTYNTYFDSIEKNKQDIFNYMNFDKLREYDSLYSLY